MYHIWGLASEDVHAHRGFDISEEEFSHPSSAIELCEGLFREIYRVEQCGGQGDLFCSKAGDIYGEGNFPYQEFIRDSLPVFFVQPFWTGAHFEPVNKPITLTKLFYQFQPDLTPMMIAHDTVDVLLG